MRGGPARRGGGHYLHVDAGRGRVRRPGRRARRLADHPPAAPGARGQDKAAAKEAYLRGLRHAPRDAILVKLADRASNVQTLRNLPPARQRAYYAQTVEHIVPLAAAEPWFSYWYASWQAEFADLEPGGPSGPSRAAGGSRLIRDTSSQTSRPTGYTK